MPATTSISMCAVATSLSDTGLPPIHVMDKPKRRKRGYNVFVNDRGFPNKTEYYKNLLHNVDSRPILCKLKHPAHLLMRMIPNLSVHTMKPNMVSDCGMISTCHIWTLNYTIKYVLVQKYWSVFDNNGVFVPLKNCKCVIDTGNAPPIAIKKTFNEPKETPIMRSAIAALKNVGQKCQINDGCWIFKALLAPKPHQEHLQNIDKFVWHFCGNYILLNSVSRIIAYPILSCNLATNEEFGLGVLYWLFDTPTGCHQLAVTLASQEKLSFQGLDAIKWTYMVMPFGPTNRPAIINFIHDINSQWKVLAQQSGLLINNNTNTKIIINNIFSWTELLDEALLYIKCQLRVCQSYQLSSHQKCKAR
jgi:hypothetical protein